MAQYVQDVGLDEFYVASMKYGLMHGFESRLPGGTIPVKLSKLGGFFDIQEKKTVFPEDSQVRKFCESDYYIASLADKKVTFISTGLFS